jgi:hypothetical protein
MTTKGLTSAIALNARLVASGIGYLIVNRYTAFLLGVFAYSLFINLLGGPGGVVIFKEGMGFIFNKQ